MPNDTATGIAYSVVDGSARITGIGTYSLAANSGALIIPATIGGYSVAEIGSYAFQGVFALKSVSIPSSVSKINSEAFRQSGLTSITIPNSVTTMGAYVFYLANSLSSVTLSNTITSIPASAFRNCSALTSITIPNSVTIIHANAFEACSNLANITLGSGVSQINDNAFINTGLTQITIPSSVTFLNTMCFAGSKLTSVTIPSTVLTIGNNAFEYISTLRSVAFSGGYRSGYAANMFTGSVGITSITTTDLSLWPASHFGGGGMTVTLAGGGGGGGDVACFAAGTRVLTQNGYKAIEALKFTDLLVTADQRIIDFKLLKTTLDTTTQRTAPYLIQPHAFGRNAPSAPIRLSANHKIQLRKGLWTSPLTAALTNPLVTQCAIGGPVTYYHIECENFLTDNIVTEGLVVESFGTVKATGGRKDIYTWNSRKNAYTRLASVESGKSSKTPL